MKVQIVEKEVQRVVGLAHQGAYTTIGKEFEELHRRQSDIGSETCGLVALYYDDPHTVPEPNLRSIAGVVVPAEADVKADGFTDVEIPAGKYAQATYVGDYAKLGTAWEEFFGSISEQGLKTKALLCYEEYLNTPAEVKPEDLKTNLYAPLV